MTACVQAGKPAHFDDCVAGFLASLPLLRAPLRFLSLSHGKRAVFTGAYTGLRSACSGRSAAPEPCAVRMSGASAVASGTMLQCILLSPAVHTIEVREMRICWFNADADLASVAAAAPQLTHLEQLDLHHVQVCPWPPVIAQMTVQQALIASGTPVRCIQGLLVARNLLDRGCMQVSEGSLQLLLALPALVRLNAWAILDDPDGVNLDSWQQEEKDTLMARLEQLQASFRSSGRTLICTDEAENVY